MVDVLSDPSGLTLGGEEATITTGVNRDVTADPGSIGLAGEASTVTTGVPRDVLGDPGSLVLGGEHTAIGSGQPTILSDPGVFALESGITVISVAGNHRAYAYIYENVGFDLPMSPRAVSYIYENVGFDLPMSKIARAYIYEGEVSDNVPNPIIWFLAPTEGRPGDGFRIYGHGFGLTAATYNGKAFLGLPLDAAHQLRVVDWGRVAASADAYNANRKITPTFINLEYGYIDVVVMEDVASAAVRVVTDA